MPHPPFRFVSRLVSHSIIEHISFLHPNHTVSILFPLAPLNSIVWFQSPSPSMAVTFNFTPLSLVTSISLNSVSASRSTEGISFIISISSIEPISVVWNYSFKGTGAVCGMVKSGVGMALAGVTRLDSVSSTRSYRSMVRIQLGSLPFGPFHRLFSGVATRASALAFLEPDKVIWKCGTTEHVDIHQTSICIALIGATYVVVA